MNLSQSAPLTFCTWAKRPEEVEYHHLEWGVPCLDDQRFFEFLILESAQAGLSWITILLKRAGYKRVFANFDVYAVARFTENDCEEAMLDSGIVRNRKKIDSAITNARCFIEIQNKYGSFKEYIWNFVDGRVAHGSWSELSQVPAFTATSEIIAKDLKKRGFKFLGPTTIYAYMQSLGLVNDHLISCFRYEEVKEISKKLGL